MRIAQRKDHARQLFPQVKPEMASDPTHGRFWTERSVYPVRECLIGSASPLIYCRSILVISLCMLLSRKASAELKPARASGLIIDTYGRFRASPADSRNCRDVRLGELRFCPYRIFHVNVRRHAKRAATELDGICRAEITSSRNKGSTGVMHVFVRESMQTLENGCGKAVARTGHE